MYEVRLYKHVHFPKLFRYGTIVPVGTCNLKMLWMRLFILIVKSWKEICWKGDGFICCIWPQTWCWNYIHYLFKHTT